MGGPNFTASQSESTITTNTRQEYYEYHVPIRKENGVMRMYKFLKH